MGRSTCCLGRWFLVIERSEVGRPSIEFLRILLCEESSNAVRGNDVSGLLIDSFSLHLTFIIFPFVTLFALAFGVAASTFKKYLGGTLNFLS
jgi:hypothetical protein